MTTTPIRLSAIGQIGISVRDLEGAIGFYRDLLGIELLFRAPPSMAFFDCGGIRLMLAEPERPELDHAASILYFRVDDIHAAHTALEGRGVTFERAPQKTHAAEDHDLWLAFFRDPENNLLALMSEVPRG